MNVTYYIVSTTHSKISFGQYSCIYYVPSAMLGSRDLVIRKMLYWPLEAPS